MLALQAKTWIGVADHTDSRSQSQHFQDDYHDVEDWHHFHKRKCDYLDTYHDPLQPEFEQYLHIFMTWLIFMLQRCVFCMEICMNAISVMENSTGFVSLVHVSMYVLQFLIKLLDPPPPEQVSFTFLCNKCYGKLSQGLFFLCMQHVTLCVLNSEIKLLYASLGTSFFKICMQ